MTLMTWLQQNIAMVLAVLLGLSESLALIPSIKANSIFQMIYNFLKSASEIGTPPK